MDRIRKTYHQEKEILVVDYCDCRGDDMIRVFDEANNLIRSENKHVVILSVFNEKSVVSPNFVRHIESNLHEVEMLIDKQAIVGISTVQQWILKGINLWYKRQIHQFDSAEQALTFLTKI